MIEAPETPHAHHKTGVPWFDLIVPIAVLCISVASLLTSLQSEKSMHGLVEQNKRLVEAQSTPMLMLDNYNLNDAGKPAVGVRLSNVGTGPARIAWFHLTDAQGQDDTGGALYERVAKLDSKASFLSEQVRGSFLRSGEHRMVFEWPRPAESSPTFSAWQEMEKARFTLHASACYCSMFDECRVTEFGEKPPVVVDSCSK